MRYWYRRAVFAVLLVFTVSSASLLLARHAPGDYVTGEIGTSGSRIARDQARARLGLDQSAGQQYRGWLLHALRFDFGRSLLYDRPVVELVPERAANTALLAMAALFVATIIGIPLGTITGSRADGVLSGVIRVASVVLLSMPPLLTSLFLVFLAARTGWLPASGMRTIVGNAAGVADVLRHMVVPVLAMALPLGALFERLQSQAMSDTVRQPFVHAARARGIAEKRIIWRGALKASLFPLASVYGLIVASLLSGSFAVEVVTAWPGLGRLMLDALRARDIYLVAGCGVAGSIFLVVGTLLSDVMAAMVDPRSRQ
jgi:peptide/nickel transport system permease protein